MSFLIIKDMKYYILRSLAIVILELLPQTRDSFSVCHIFFNRLPGRRALVVVFIKNMLFAEVDPGSVKRGGRASKFLDAAPENNKNRPPLDPPLFRDNRICSV